MADVQRMRDVIAAIEQQPHLHRQTAWVTQTHCGTAYCFAGWALKLDGIDICVDECFGVDGVAHVHRDSVPAELDRVLVDYYGERYIESFGYWMIHQVAGRLLDLNPLQANNLFCATRSLRQLRDLVHRYSLHGQTV